MTQFILTFGTESLLNKVKLEERRNKDWPTRKAHAVMTNIKTVYEPSDTMAEMDMEIEFCKLMLGLKKNPKDLNDKLAAIKFCFGIELTNAKKKAQILRLGGTHDAGVITLTTLLQKQQGKVETSAMLLQEMHNQ